MKKRQRIITLLLFAVVCMSFIETQAQSKYIDKNGKLGFEASEELFEPVKAENNSVTVILDTETNKIASLALMKSFRFKNSLMEEHFNENYIESETYPKAIFKGELVDFNFSNITEVDTEVVLEGEIELRDKAKQISTILLIRKVKGVLLIKGSFVVSPSDFDIEIPSVVENKIAKEIIVTLDFKLSQK